MKRLWPLLLGGALAGCDDGVLLQSLEGDVTLVYSCSAYQPVAVLDEDFDLLEELAMTAYRHAMGQGRGAEAATLPSLRHDRRFEELEQALVEYFCQNRDALGGARVPIVRHPILVDSIAPNFSLPTLVATHDGSLSEGGRITLASYRGSIVVLHPMATWCPPCRTEHQALIEFLADAPEGVEFLGVITKDAASHAMRWLQENGGLPFPIVLDQNNRMANRYGIRGFPQLYVIDRDGRVVHHQRSEDGLQQLKWVLAELTGPSS